MSVFVGPPEPYHPAFGAEFGAKRGGKKVREKEARAAAAAADAQRLQEKDRDAATESVVAQEPQVGDLSVKPPPGIPRPDSPWRRVRQGLKNAAAGAAFVAASAATGGATLAVPALAGLAGYAVGNHKTPEKPAPDAPEDDLDDEDNTPLGKRVAQTAPGECKVDEKTRKTLDTQTIKINRSKLGLDALKETVRSQITDHGIIHAKMVAMKNELAVANEKLKVMEAKAQSPSEISTVEIAMANVQACTVNMASMETEISLLEKSIDELTTLIKQMDEATQSTLTDFKLLS